MNGLTGRTIQMPLRFLAARKYHATLVRDQMDNPAAVQIDIASVTRGESLTIRMRAGGGFVARFEFVEI